MMSPTPYAEVIGDPIAHSKSPLIHGFWLGKLGLEGAYRATRVTTDELHLYLAERRRDPSWRGCNVTMPLKRAVVPYAGRLSDDTSVLGAANLLLPDGQGVLRAENSDVRGVAEPLSRLPRADYPGHVATYVQIIGSGGAAFAAGLGAARAGFGDFDVFCRSREQGLTLAGLIGTPFGECQSIDALGPIRNPDSGPEDQRYSHVIINATPLGMAGQPEVPVDLSSYYPDTIVFEMVYHPLETGLVKQARALGLRVIDGVDMLVAQGARAFEAFYGHSAPREHDAELRRLLIQ
ncbi:shikimate dehydrogenase [uncultured Sphingomonas sp.]|uniref:shikimate dehydrogenase family protein n=1 Tax=uncultured Sphingomonas sp. TaxID=158754 RepID=UPI0025E6C321|nr:shikimate dehydrogenase [uncultured Sphingomonas sp.]